MRFDLISIFPDYFAPLRLSLMGKAEDAGLVHLQAHDLREWATGKHRSVDDTPYGGGAGMVMRADVWARALDEVLATPLAERDGDGTQASPRRVLAIPTPSGTPLTQARVEDLARANQIIVACGRYEGIDARVAEYYRGAGVEVVEFSIGDYVLNGGEVAAMVLTEAVARLLEGFMGNPGSLVEESHSGAGLLEYPVFTKPREFRSLEIPEVLLGGNHAAIERWRRDRAIEKTARVRPDLALSLDASSLTREDRAMLARCGVAYPRAGGAERLDVRQAELEDVVAVSEGLKHLVTPLFGFSLQFSRDVDRVVVSAHRLVVPDQSLHRDEVNDTAESFFLTDGDLNGARGSTEDGLDLTYYFKEVSTGAVHLVDVAHAGYAVLISLTPYGLTLGLYTTDSTERSDSTIEDTERALYFDGEVNVPWGVDEVDLVLGVVVVPEGSRSSGGNRDTTLLLLLHPVHRSTTIVYFTDLVGQTRIKEDTLRRSRLTGIDVGHDADISREL